MKPFPLNAWYAAAYDVEVKAALLSRTLCNQKIVMFRRKDGSVAALEDACWHRLLPLSKGRLHDDQKALERQREKEGRQGLGRNLGRIHRGQLVRDQG